MALKKRTKACGQSYLKTRNNLSRGRLDRCRFLRDYRRSNKDIVNQETPKLLHDEIKSCRIHSRIFNKREFNGKGQIFFERHQTRRQLQIPPLKSTRRCFETNTQKLRLIDIPVTHKRIFHTCEPIEASLRWDSNNNARRSSSQTPSRLRRFRTNRCKRRKYTLLKVPVKPRLGMMAKSHKSRYRITPCPTGNASRSRVGWRTSYTHSFNNRNQSRRGSSYRSFRPRHRTRYRRHVGESRFVIYSRPASIRRRGRRRRRTCQCQQSKSRTRTDSRKNSAQRKQESARTRRSESKSGKSSGASSKHGFLQRVSSMFYDTTKKTSKGRGTSKTRHSTCAKKPKVSKSKASNKSRRGKSSKSRTENTKSAFVCSIM